MQRLANKMLQLGVLCFLGMTITGCYTPPYNNFRPHNRMIKPAVQGVGVGAAVGTATGNALAGAAVGGIGGTAVGVYRGSKKNLLNELENQSIQYVQYGDTRTLIVPTDKYFLHDSPRLNELAYPGLENIVRLLRFYPTSNIVVASFTDDIGSKKSKQKLTQAQAEAMLTFLWANDIKAQRLKAQGYGDKHAIGNNQLIHGSAFNRRLEIQWVNADKPIKEKRRFFGWKK